MCRVRFAIARASAWPGRWPELQRDAQPKIIRPRQLYPESAPRGYVEIGRLDEAPSEPAR